MMKISIIGALAILFFSTCTYSQVTEQQFARAVNYVNCKSVELSLKKSPTGGVTAVFQSKCNCESDPDFTNISKAISASETKTSELAQAIEKIKGTGFKPGFNRDDAIKLLTSDIFSDKDKYPTIFSFAENRRKEKNSKFDLFTSALKTKLNSIFVPGDTIPPPPSLTLEQLFALYQGLESKVGVLEKKIADKEKSKSWFDGFTFQIDVLAILFTIILLFLLIKYRDKVLKRFSITQQDETKLSNNDKNWVIKKITDLAPDFTLQFSNSKEKKDLVVRIVDLESQVRKLNEKKTDKTDSGGTKTNFENMGSKESKSPGKSNEDFFYLSGPNQDGSFNVSSEQSAYKDGTSIYRLQKISANRAEFQIEDKEQVLSVALSFPERTIDPVCESSNPFNPSSKRIYTDKPGEVELLEDKWKLIRKAKIHYDR